MGSVYPTPFSGLLVHCVVIWYEVPCFGPTISVHVRFSALRPFLTQLCWLGDADLFFYFCASNWDQIRPTVSGNACTDSMETSVSSSVIEALSSSTICTLVRSLLKEWLTTGQRCHKLTSSQSKVPCGQLWPLHQATWHSKTCDVLCLEKTSQRPGEVFAKMPKVLGSSDFALHLHWKQTVTVVLLAVIFLSITLQWAKVVMVHFLLGPDSLCKKHQAWDSQKKEGIQANVFYQE